VLSKTYDRDGKHLKVYNSDLREVLEHPSEEVPLSADFSYDHANFIITAKGFLKRAMLREEQKNRGDYLHFAKSSTYVVKKTVSLYFRYTLAQTRSSK
jgi:hypothetical protein